MADQEEPSAPPTFNTQRLAESRDGKLRDRTSRAAAAGAETERPGRTLGIYTGPVPGKSFGFIKDADREEYFAHITGFVTAADFEGLPAGTAVSFRVRSTGKGQRALDIRQANAAEQEEIDGWAEDRGNR